MKSDKPYITWEEVKENLNLTEEQELMVQFEMGIMEAEIEARQKNQLTQRELSRKSGIKQSAIARIEKCVNSPQLSTLLKLLYPMGYTLKVVPISEVLKQPKN